MKQKWFRVVSASIIGSLLLCASIPFFASAAADPRTYFNNPYTISKGNVVNTDTGTGTPGLRLNAYCYGVASSYRNDPFYMTLQEGSKTLWWWNWTDLHTYTFPGYIGGNYSDRYGWGYSCTTYGTRRLSLENANSADTTTISHCVFQQDQ